MNVVDLFAGPGGWDVAGQALGLDPLGIEWDEAACATRRAAGLTTLRQDVAAIDPRAVVAGRFGASAKLDGLIGSPPCQAFSMAGKGEGRKAIGALLTATAALGTPREWTRAALDAACEDDRAHLVLEPLRWTLALRPRWVALEQVEPVLPLWEAMADRLRELGYSTWAGVLSAERFGVPQTRRRAILLASLDRTVSEPVATHRRYIAPRRNGVQAETLFEAPEPERIELAEEQHLLPWVSMAEALGWGMTARPYPVLASSRSTGGPDKEKVGGSGARETIYAEQVAGRWVRLETGTRENATGRDVGEPAPTLAFGHDAASHRWVLRTGNFTAVRRDADGERSAAGSEPYERPVSEPAPTIRAGGAGEWTTERPATTVAGDPRIFAPGHKLNADDERAGRGGQRRSGRGWAETRPSTTITGTARSEEGGTLRTPNAGRGDEAQAVRVSVAEAAVLQSFPPDYPWQGTRTKQFEQVGNAVPPLLALRVLEAVLS